MIKDAEFTPTIPLKALVDGCSRLSADVFQMVTYSGDKPVGAVVVLTGPDTKAYLQALRKTDDLIEEDRMEDDDIPF